MFVEIHMIQNFAPSCLNRDDTNSPKDCVFGGHRRARISSQCLKRSIRKNPIFVETLDRELGYRTKNVYDLLYNHFKSEEMPDDVIYSILSEFITATLSSMDTKKDKKDKTKVLCYIGNADVDSMKNVLKSNWETLRIINDTKKLKKKCEEIAKECEFGNLTPDIALFGRMMAKKTDLNVDAAAQVAHAISTNRVSTDIDFYTAIDDLQPGEETGAGMMGTIEFNSACFYRYSLVDLGQLQINLKGDNELSAKTIEAFIRSSVAAIPSGKQTSMAAHNPPSFVMVLIRESGQPMSLANAFSKPVSVFESDSRDLVEESICRLDQYMGQLIDLYGNDGIKYIGFCTLGDKECKRLADVGANKHSSLVGLISSMAGTLNDGLNVST